VTEYRVECRGEVREVYVVDAASPEDARERWHEGDLVLSEAYGVAPESVVEEDPHA
jgi:hypothetical protein